MRTSFHHQPEAQHPKSSAIHKLPADYPICWVTCGRRHGKSFFDVSAALVGCGHVSGLLMRRVWPLALMLCADRVPIVNTHF